MATNLHSMRSLEDESRPKGLDMAVNIDFLTYQGALNDDYHEHVQIVLVLDGVLELEVNGQADRLDTSLAAFIKPCTPHSQFAPGPNRAIIINCDLCEIDLQAAELLAKRVFVPISPAARRLLEFADLSNRRQTAHSEFFSHWVPLLLGSLPAHSPPPSTRISMLQSLFEHSPATLPSVGEMARRTGLSTGRLHALFMSELRQSPQKWLAEQRVRKAQELLAQTDLSVAELVQQVGYSDQSALTKAMRRVTGHTPAAYRRRQRDT